MTAEQKSQLNLLEREGLAWIHRITSGSATRGDIEDMKRWRNLSAAHADALARATRVHRNAQDYVRTIEDDAVPVNVIAFPKPVTPKPVNMGRRMFLGGSMAAGLAAAALYGPRAYRSFEIMQADYQTDIGERRSIRLPLAEAQLNSRSAITLEPGGVKLLTGEIALNVDTGKRMKVDTGNAAVMATGARLNIRKDEAETCVSCLAGRVAIAHPSQTQPLDLQPGQQVRYTSETLQAAQAVDIAQATAWQKGEIVFRDAHLTTVVAELNRYRRGRIVLVNSALEPTTFNGVVRLNEIDDALDQIARECGAKPVKLPGDLLILT